MGSQESPESQVWSPQLHTSPGASAGQEPQLWGLRSTPKATLRSPKLPPCPPPHDTHVVCLDLSLVVSVSLSLLTVPPKWANFTARVQPEITPLLIQPDPTGSLAWGGVGPVVSAHARAPGARPRGFWESMGPLCRLPLSLSEGSRRYFCESQAEASPPPPSFPPSRPTLVIPGLGPNPCWLR